MNERIYADHAATTSLSPAALEVMTPYLTGDFGNPSSIHSFGEDAARAVAKARSTIADILNFEPECIIFTSGGSEADNQAIRTLGSRGGTILVSEAEHHAVLFPAKDLESSGIPVIFVSPCSNGAVSADAVASAIESIDGKLGGGSFMLANNETGSIFDIRKISDVIHDRGGIIHTDAVQAVGHIPVNFCELGVDMLSLSAHKFHGPKGVGALIFRPEVLPLPHIRGGSQERGLRAGTENVAGIVGMAAALSESVENMERNTLHVERLKSMLFDSLRPFGAAINGGGLPGILSVSFPGGDGEALVRSLDLFGIAASAGAACNSKEVGASHVLLSMGLSHERAESTVRFSLDASNTEEEILRIISVMNELM